MATVQVSVRGGKSKFLPFERVTGTASWSLESPPKSVTINLLWNTVGRGTTDVEIVASELVAGPTASGSRDFSFELPDAPYSFSGSLITLAWAIEAIAEPSGDAGRFDFTLSPNGEEISISSKEDEELDESTSDDPDEGDDGDDDQFEVDRDRFKK